MIISIETNARTMEAIARILMENDPEDDRLLVDIGRAMASLIQGKYDSATVNGPGRKDLIWVSTP